MDYDKLTWWKYVCMHLPHVYLVKKNLWKLRLPHTKLWNNLNHVQVFYDQLSSDRKLQAMNQLSDWTVKSFNYLLTVSELHFLQYHVCTIKVFINKRVCDHVKYSILFIWEIPPVAGGATGSKFNMAHQE